MYYYVMLNIITYLFFFPSYCVATQSFLYSCHTNHYSYCILLGCVWKGMLSSIRGWHISCLILFFICTSKFTTKYSLTTIYIYTPIFTQHQSITTLFLSHSLSLSPTYSNSLFYLSYFLLTLSFIFFLILSSTFVLLNHYLII